MLAPCRVLLLSTCLGLGLWAQDPPPPLQLATVLAQGAALNPQLPAVHWRPGGHEATVVRAGADGHEALHGFADGKLVEPPLATAAALRQALGEPGDGPAKFGAIGWHDAATLRALRPQAVWHWRPGQERAERVLQWPAPAPGQEAREAVAPGDQRVAYVHHHQLWLHDRSGKRRQLTFDGGPDLVYGSAAHRAEFGIDRGLYWSADGRFLAVTREDLRPVAAVPYLDASATPAQPVAGRYPVAGSRHSKVRVGVVDTQDDSVVWLEADPAEDVYWTNLAFAPDGTLCAARVSRGQDHCELVRYDSKSGKRLATLLEERDPQWVEPEHPPTFLPDGRFVWWSSRAGHRHLWLCPPGGGEPQQITKGAFDVQQLLAVAADGKTLVYQASGEDPRQLHLFAANLDGTEVRQLTRERGTHRAVLSPDGAFAHVVWSNLETPPQARLLELGSGAVQPLPEGRNPLLAHRLPAQRLFQAKAEDDTVLYGHLLLPPDLAEGQQAPALLYVYGGPHVQLVTDQWYGGAPPWLLALANEGYVVCRLDNRGTPNRGIEFEQCVHRRLGHLEVQDQLRAVEYLKQQPFVDGERIGVHGWSYGGYLTLRLLLGAPTVFACGVSGAPVTDWRGYETGYTERYMDLPEENEAGYAAASCLPLVGQLQRPLLLVHGSDDRTVLWGHTLQFLDRCVAAGKVVDYFVYPDQQHGLQGQSRKHFLGLLQGYLARHLRPEVRKVKEPVKPPEAESKEGGEGGGKAGEKGGEKTGGGGEKGR